MAKTPRVPSRAIAADRRAIAGKGMFALVEGAKPFRFGGAVKLGPTPTTREQSKGPYERLFDAAPIAISVTRGTKVLYANAAYLEMFGIPSVDQLRDVDMLELFPPEWRPPVAENMRRWAEGLPAPASYEADHLRKDGTKFPALFHVVGAEFADGPATVTFVTDVTQWRQTERAARERSNLLEQLLKAVPVPLYYVDMARRFVATTRPMRRRWAGPGRTWSASGSSTCARPSSPSTWTRRTVGCWAVPVACGKKNSCCPARTAPRSTP